MDEQGIDKALMFPAAAHDIEPREFADDIDALYANIRPSTAGCTKRSDCGGEPTWLPPYISFADPDRARRATDRHG